MILRQAVLLFAAIAGFASASQAQTSRLWQETLPDKAVAFDSTPFGVLVQLKAGFFAVDPETGKHLWMRPDVSDNTIVTGTRFGIVETAAGKAVVDLESGQDKWKLASLGLTSIKGIVHLPSVGLLLVYGESRDSPHTLVAAKYESGDVLWKQTALYPDPALAPKLTKLKYTGYVLDTETTVVLDPSEDGLIRLDLASGRILWRISEQALDSGGKPLRMVAADGRILAAYEKKLLAVAAGDGKVLWTRPEKFPSPVAQLVSTPQGVLVRGAYNLDQHNQPAWNPYLALLDAATGATKWTTEKTKFEGRSSFLLEDGTIAIAAKEAFATYDLVSGKVANSVGMEKFSGGEDACCLERFDDGRLLVWSSQNLRMIDRAGKPVYSVYLKAPGASFMAKLAAAAVDAAAAGAAGGYSVTPNAVMTAKYKATVDAKRFTYIFTEVPDAQTKFALVRIDKETGRETGRLWLAERSPSFRVDPATGVVVVIENGTLSGARFDSAAK
jgi:outer membrane protein assembly factor BamB